MSLDLTPPHLETPRLRVRPVAETDLQALMAVNGDDQVTRFLPYATWRSMDDAQAWYKRIAGLQDSGSAIQLVAADKATGSAIATCLLFQFDQKSDRAELGYVLGRAHWGKGFMREALSAVLDHAFGPMRVRRLEAHVDPRNEGSRGLALRLGFTREGLLRERWVDKDVPTDIEVYGLLSREWRRPA
ncbi:MAG TPA: GNAT family protein [Usitatibacter sp.]|nr:GNAT family protein [Usitatibacter sp.]